MRTLVEIFVDMMLTDERRHGIMKSADLSMLDAQGAVDYGNVEPHTYHNVVLEYAFGTRGTRRIELYCEECGMALLRFDEPEREDD
jgi:hypothetical protein